MCDARLRIDTRARIPDAEPGAVGRDFACASLTHSKNPRGEGAHPARPEEPPAPTKDLRRLLSSLKDTLSLSGYPGRGHSREVIAEIESFVKRGKPTAREVTLLLGALAAVRRRLGA